MFVCTGWYSFACSLLLEQDRRYRVEVERIFFLFGDYIYFQAQGTSISVPTSMRLTLISFVVIS